MVEIGPHLHSTRFLHCADDDQKVFVMPGITISPRDPILSCARCIQDCGFLSHGKRGVKKHIR